jgi:hypothetical protein
VISFSGLARSRSSPIVETLAKLAFVLTGTAY